MSSEDQVLTAMLASLPNRYEVKQQVGAGGMALVFRGRDRTTGDTVALKIIRPQLLDDPHARALFEHEGEVSLKLTHRNIVRVRAVLPLAHNGRAIVLDFIAGASLKALLRERGPLAFDHAIAVLVDVASALEYAHLAGLVHRDIKPENIFIDQRSGRALVADFGIAHPVGAPLSDPRDSTHGTPAYMSPEHVEGGPMDGRGDIYSLGCVAYELLTGQPPWVGLGLGDVLERQRHERLPPIHASRADIPAWLEEVVARAVAKRPEERWPDMKAFAAALSRRSAPAAPPASRGRARTLVGISVSLVGATALFLAGRSNGAATASAAATRLPGGPTQVDPRLLADRPGDAGDAGENAVSNGASQAMPTRTAPPDAPAYDDTEALRLLASAVSAQGTADAFRLIAPLSALARLETVSPAIRARLQSLAASIQRQCTAAAALDESIICG